MKRLILALVTAAAVASVASDARALGAYASWWNMNDSSRDGFGFGVRQPIRLGPLFMIDTRAAYVNFSDSDLKVFPLEAAGLVSLGLFYGGLGAGYYLFDAQDNQNDVKNNFGWFVVGGASVGFRAVSLFAEAKWTQLEADYKNIDPNLSNVPTSIKADGWGLNAGVLFGL